MKRIFAFGKVKAMKGAIVKRSVKVDGRKTSVSLEDEFWQALLQIAEGERVPVWKIVQQIDHKRHNANLSSAIRVYVLKHFRAAGHDTETAAALASPPPQARAAAG